jgi:hypothetical protein
MSSYRVTIPEPTLETARRFLESRGEHGLEGTGLFACRRNRKGNWIADRFVSPQQHAHRTPDGCWVEVTDFGKRQLAVELRPGELFLVRIHSHPGEAFHSATDDRNPALTFDGALSVVAPYYGRGLRHGFDACAIYRLANGKWSRLADDRAQWIVSDLEESCHNDA